jgi:hypothetical protein
MILDTELKPFARAIYLNSIIYTSCMVLKINNCNDSSVNLISSNYEIIENTEIEDKTTQKEIVQKFVDKLIKETIETIEHKHNQMEKEVKNNNDKNKTTSILQKIDDKYIKITKKQSHEIIDTNSSCENEKLGYLKSLLRKLDLFSLIF